MHKLYLVIYSQKTKALGDKKSETHFLLSLICSYVLAFLTSGFSEASCAFAKPFLAETSRMHQPCRESAYWKMPVTCISYSLPGPWWGQKVRFAKCTVTKRRPLSALQGSHCISQVSGCRSAGPCLVQYGHSHDLRSI